MEKSLGPQGNIASWFIAPFEKTWLCKRLLFKVVIIMEKNRKYSIKDTMSIKICFTHSCSGQVMLAVVFKESEMIYIFLLHIFFFPLSLSIGKWLTIAKIWGSPLQQHRSHPFTPPPLPISAGLPFLN